MLHAGILPHFDRLVRAGPASKPAMTPASLRTVALAPLLASLEDARVVGEAERSVGYS